MTNLQTLFPNGSNAFFQANHQIQSTKSEQAIRSPLVSSVSNEKASMGRVVLSFKGCFVKLKDPDNFISSLKNLIDGLRRLHLIHGDEPDKIKIEAEQEKVEHYAQERIELTIKYP